MSFIISFSALTIVAGALLTILNSSILLFGFSLVITSYVILINYDLFNITNALRHKPILNNSFAINLKTLCTEQARDLLVAWQQFFQRFRVFEEQMLSGYFHTNKLEFSETKEETDKLPVIDQILKKHHATIGLFLTFDMLNSKVGSLSSQELELKLETYLVKQYSNYFYTQNEKLTGYFELADDFELGSRLRPYSISSYVVIPAILVQHNKKGLLFLAFSSSKEVSVTERYKFYESADYLLSHTASLEKFEKLDKKARVLEEEKNRASQFLSQLTHDMRSPLHNIKVILNLYNSELDSATKNEFLDMALRNCATLDDLITDILDYNRYSLGQLDAKVSKFALSELLEEVYECFKLRVKSEEVRFKINNLANADYIEADRSQLKRILSNLVTNAIKYTHKGQIELQITNNEEFVQIAINDTGQGMTEQQIKDSFKPFTRFANDRDGVGLGLTICKILTELNNGQIHITSNINSGTSVNLNFKLALKKEITSWNDLQVLAKTTH
jgi:signal transduction histidine kinase